jgi:hypothetical protein
MKYYDFDPLKAALWFFIALSAVLSWVAGVIVIAWMLE